MVNPFTTQVMLTAGRPIRWSGRSQANCQWRLQYKDNPNESCPLIEVIPDSRVWAVDGAF